MNVLCTMVFNRNLKIACAVYSLLFICPFTALGQSASYRVHLTLNRPLNATVEAQLQAPDGVIFTAPHAGGYGWWDYIKNLRQVNDGGSSTPLRPAGDGRWILAATASGPVRVTYEV